MLIIDDISQFHSISSVMQMVLLTSIAAQKSVFLSVYKMLLIQDVRDVSHLH